MNCSGSVVRIQDSLTFFVYNQFVLYNHVLYTNQSVLMIWWLFRQKWPHHLWNSTYDGLSSTLCTLWFGVVTPKVQDNQEDFATWEEVRSFIANFILAEYSSSEPRIGSACPFLSPFSSGDWWFGGGCFRTNNASFFLMRLYNLTKHIRLHTLDMKSLKTKIQYMHVNDQQI